jgi:hypothetical protein
MPTSFRIPMPPLRLNNGACWGAGSSGPKIRFKLLVWLYNASSTYGGPAAQRLKPFDVEQWSFPQPA